MISHLSWFTSIPCFSIQWLSYTSHDVTSKIQVAFHISEICESRAFKQYYRLSKSAYILEEALKLPKESYKAYLSTTSFRFVTCVNTPFLMICKYSWSKTPLKCENWLSLFIDFQTKNLKMISLTPWINIPLFCVAYIAAKISMCRLIIACTVNMQKMHYTANYHWLSWLLWKWSMYF